MNIPTRNEIEYTAKTRSNSSNSVYLGFLKGVYWLLDYQKLEPHVAEVVKCGDVNKPKTQIERRNNLIQQLSRRNPTRNLDYILKKVDSIMSDKANIHTYGFFDEVVDFDHAINQHPVPEEELKQFGRGILRQIIENPVIETDREVDHPIEWFDKQFRKDKESSDLKIRNLITDTRRHLFELNQEAAELGMAGSRKDITDMVSKCDHKGLLKNHGVMGVSCAQCGEWIKPFISND